VVLPVKGGDAAKSRLGPAGAHRAALARALGLDCLAAATACRPDVASTVVVTQDPVVARESSRLGARVVPESRPGSGLLAAVSDGLAAVADGPVAVLLADVPALRPDDLAAALAAVSAALGAGAASAFVPDADGTGTVLLAAADRSLLAPRFGDGSALAHERGGSVRLDVDLPRLRRDVDTPSGLAEAVSLGVGPRTACALGLPSPAAPDAASA
jgi:2-phospho-L-lactate guanylyltransferase